MKTALIGRRYGGEGRQESGEIEFHLECQIHGYIEPHVCLKLQYQKRSLNKFVTPQFAHQPRRYEQTE